MKNIALFGLLLVMILSPGCAGQKQTATPPPQPPAVPDTTKYSNYELPITERTFYIGVVPTPKSVPQATQQEVIDAYKEAGQIGEVTMVWPDGGWYGACERLQKSRTIEGLRNMGLKPIINLNFYTVKQVEGKGLQIAVDAPAGVNASLGDGEFRRMYVEEARTCARLFKPEYISLGNEVGAWNANHPESFDDYVSLYKEAYDAVKQESPDTKVFVVFSLNQMEDANQWDLIQRFEPKLDLAGITTYPWSKYGTPEEMPADYYSRLKKYTGRQVAFTEIGWISDGAGSENKQARYLVRFLNLTKGMNIEMVNWLFLHEPQGIGGVAGALAAQETKSIALKKADGSEKEVYLVWKDLHQLAKK